jgi:hypothetical protein
MKLHIIIRTHDGQNIHGNRPRYIDVSKKHLIIGCLSSLINSTNSIKNHSIQFTILDDHSSSHTIEQINYIFKHSQHSWELIHLKEKGFNHSSYMQFLTCRDSDADLVYSVEDDYLHCMEAIPEMLFTYDYLKSYYHLKKELCLFPFDSPEDYQPNQIYPGRTFRTSFRHWKEGINTTFTMMTPPKVFREHWEVFEKLSLKYKPFVICKGNFSFCNGSSAKNINPDEIIDEGNTISNIWEKNVIRVNPIPSLALHVQFESQRDPHINHLEWWNKYSKINPFEINYD